MPMGDGNRAWKGPGQQQGSPGRGGLHRALGETVSVQHWAHTAGGQGRGWVKPRLGAPAGWALPPSSSLPRAPQVCPPPLQRPCEVTGSPQVLEPFSHDPAGCIHGSC